MGEWRQSASTVYRTDSSSAATQLPNTECLPASDCSLRIAFFTETFLPKIDGVVTRLCQTIRHLVRLGHQVLIVAPDGNIDEYEGARVYGVPGPPFPLYPDMKMAFPRPSIGKVLAGFRPDLIHCIQPMLLGTAAFYYSSQRRVPLIISYHAQIDRYLHYYGISKLQPLFWMAHKSAYNGADLVLCTSQVMVDLLRRQGIQRVDLWQRGVDTETFHPDRASRQMRARLTEGHPEDKLMVYIGRLSAEKGIEAALLILEAIPGIRLALIGDGPHRAKLQQHFAGSRTHFAGYLKGAELASAYASADVFFMPSRTETLGLVVLEAMASGTPVVAAAEGGLVDIVRDGVTGHLYHGDAAAAVAEVQKLLFDPVHHAHLRRAARFDAEQWTWARATRQLEDFYRNILKREQELAGRIAGYRAPRVSQEEMCAALQISKATLRRHERLLATCISI
jgi:glycosyltransferase involved in cell wall biosynthesis